MQFTNSLLVVALALTSSVSGAAVASMPKAQGSVTYKAAQKITGTFDGGMKRYGRGVSCSGQSEGGDKDAVFQLADGATLKNAIIGKDQIEGVHCMGSCTIENVWWEDVCEDAITLKQKSGTSIIKGGGALHAADKVIQHNGGGVVKVQDFYVNDFGKLYRSCGNCKTQYKRSIELSGVIAVNGKYLTGANEKYGDTVKITNTCAKSVKKICSRYDGNNSGAEPKELSSGPDSKVCLYKASDISSNC